MKKKLPTDCFMFQKRNFTLATLRGMYKKKIFLLAMLFLFLSALSKSSAQIIADGQEHSVLSTGSFQDLVIPNNPLITKIRFTLSGADGGAAVLHMGQHIPVPFSDDIFIEAFKYSAGGGSGAVVNGTFLVGSGPGKIPPGSTVRFIIGQKGESGHDNISVIPDGGTGSEYGGGGGGSAILYRAPGGSTWTLLCVAGGGGGAYQGVVSGVAIGLGDAGGAGEETENGANGGGIDYGIGGINGGGGNRSVGIVGISPIGAGGGGRFTNGNGLLTYVDIIDITLDEEELEEAEFGEGGAGKPGGFDFGGYGGNSESQPTEVFTLALRNGGFGYGGGGVGVGTGGGGGGYSGGGAGGLFNSGGGGGSHLNGIRETGNVSGGGSDTEPDDGIASYQVTINQPPVALCKNVTVYLSATGQASIVVADVNNGSNDPDDNPLTYSLSKSNFNCADAGNNNVTLTVTDIHGAASTCTAVVTVIDNTAPVITCPANITVSCAANVPAVNTASVTSGDNCPVTITHVSDDITNKTCANQFTLTRTYKATDASGNSATCSQVITVFDNTAPVISNASTNVVSLWPANHKMKDVIVNYNTADNCNGVTTTLTVSSNEPINGTGDGDTSPDWQIVNNHLVKLRAERAGNGNGRIYTITIRATDGCNNSSTKVLLVYVNHSNAVTATRPGTQGAGQTKSKELSMTGSLRVAASPNPTNNLFSIHIESNNEQDKISMQVYDILGRSVELRNNLQTGTNIIVGDKYKAGAYFMRIMQGTEYKVIRLIKLPD
jgi:hypothetical protein